MNTTPLTLPPPPSQQILPSIPSLNHLAHNRARSVSKNTTHQSPSIMPRKMKQALLDDDPLEAEDELLTINNEYASRHDVRFCSFDP